jgi:FdhD protein
MPTHSSEHQTTRSILRYEKGVWSSRNDPVTSERPLHIRINGNPFITLLCTPVQRKELVAGFLLSEGFIDGTGQIGSIELDAQADTVSVALSGVELDLEERVRNVTLTSGCGRGTILCDVMDALEGPRATGKVQLTPEQILARMRDLQRHSTSYLKTGGTHSAAVTDGERLIAFAEDLGRHNAVDKVLGACCLDGIETKDKAVFSSGRISSEIIMKVARSGVPVLVTRAAPTDQVIQIAETLLITLVGFARGNRMNVYSCPERISGSNESKA